MWTLTDRSGRIKASPPAPEGWTVYDARGVPKTTARAGLFNVLDFGATGDGVTDDTAAIQAALDACGTSGGIVYFPAGTYIITAPLLIPAGSITIRGADKSRTQIRKTTNTAGVGTDRAFRSGTVTDAFSTTDAILMIDHADETYARYVTISDLYLVDAAPSTISHAIYAPRIAYATIERVRTYGCSNGIFTKNIFVATFSHVVCKGLGKTSGTAFNLNYDAGHGAGTSVNFQNCYADTWQTGYYAYGLNYSSLHACACDNIGTADTKGIAYRFYLCQGISMNGCGSEVVYGTVIAVDGGTFTCNGFRTENINGTTAAGNAYLEIGRNSVNTRATFIGCYFEPFTTPNAGLNLICRNTAHLVYINTLEPSGGNAFLSLSGSIQRIQGGNVDTTGNLLPEGYLRRDKSATIHARAVQCGQTGDVAADTFTTIFSLSTTDGSFSTYRSIFSGILTVSGHMRTSGGAGRFIAASWLITIYKFANSNLAMMSTPLAGHHTGAGGEAIAIQSANATATGLDVQAKINCTNYGNGNIVWELHGACGSSEAASMINLTEA
jgi:hypothetical protein